MGQWQRTGDELGFAFRAAGDIEAGEALDPFGGGFLGFVVGGFGRRRCSERGADGFEGLLFVGVGEEPEAADFFEAGG